MSTCAGICRRQFSDDEIEFVQILANQTAVAVGNARLLSARSSARR